MSFPIYQYWKSKIISETNYSNWVMNLSHSKELTEDEIKGLIREWRAYWFLVNHKHMGIPMLATQEQDKVGIDLVSNKEGKIIFFQVGGEKTGKEKCGSHIHYYVQVTPDKIYLHKLRIV